MKFLIIEDDLSSFRIIETILVGLDIPIESIVWNSTIEAAERRMDTESIDVIFLDLNLPGDDQDQVIEFISKHKKKRIIVYSGTEDDQVILKCMRAGAVHFLGKNYMRKVDVKRALLYVEPR